MSNILVKDDRDALEIATGSEGLGDRVDQSIVDVTLGQIPDGSLTNAKISASAAISFSKLAALPSADILVGNNLNSATPVAMSGDISIDNTGATAIGSGKVLKAMLGTGIKASHMVVAAGSHTTAGGAPSEDIIVAGALSSDLAFVVMKAVGMTPVTLLTSIAASGKITLTFSADPSTDHVVVYQLLRATS